MALAPFAPQFKASIGDAVRLFGVPSQVEKHEAPSPIPGPVVAVARRRPEDRTEGLEILRTVIVAMIDEWDAAIGRAPERGDVIIAGGVRYGVTDAAPSAVSGVSLTYEIAVAT
ncbi:MAG: hypothetical protein ACE37J_12250 [Pikeienuella sp.]|uniref:hypothetical protein n=1 Tax=Pikeienuella sp. TaxID=2831957 RepID=UPI00391D3139